MTFEELCEFLHQLAESPCFEAESFTELDHALQFAWNLWQTHPNDTELVIAGLVHDIGHQLGADDEHGLARSGRRPTRSRRPCRRTRSWPHPAKRYLVATDPTYAEQLSPLSVVSLAHQGGAAISEEIETWKQSAFFSDAVELRRADDQAKVAGRPVPGLDRWIPLLDAHAR